jgi:hypothetical protein
MDREKITGTDGHHRTKEEGHLHINGRLTLSPLWKTEVRKMEYGRTGYCAHHLWVRPIR